MRKVLIALTAAVLAGGIFAGVAYSSSGPEPAQPSWVQPSGLETPQAPAMLPLLKDEHTIIGWVDSEGGAGLVYADRKGTRVIGKMGGHHKVLRFVPGHMTTRGFVRDR